MISLKSTALLVSCIFAMLCTGCGNTISEADKSASVTTASASQTVTSSVTEAPAETSASASPETSSVTEAVTTADTTTAATTTTAETTTAEPETTTAKATATTTVTTTTTPKQTQAPVTSTTTVPPVITTPPAQGTTEKETAPPSPVNPGAVEQIQIPAGTVSYDSFYKNQNTNYLYTSSGFTQADIEKIKYLTFVGDSVCSGLKVYNWMHQNQVLAAGSAAPWNIFKLHTLVAGTWFNVNGGSYDFATAYKLAKPGIVICSMGINQLNMTSAEQFVNDYLALCDWMKSVTPNAKIYIATVTPTDNANFSMAKVNAFNAALKNSSARIAKGYGFIDIYSGLLGATGRLDVRNYWAGGDGIHLTNTAYGKILRQVCDQIELVK